MRSHRFYTPDNLLLDQTIELDKEASHHCIQVLRYKTGHQLELFNGDGFDYHAEITAIEGKKCWARIIKQIPSNNESPLNIHLFQGVAKGDKMDLIIQKTIELGVKQITPIFTQRCNVKLDNKRQIKKMNHWQKVIISACEQSGRSIIPQLNMPIQLAHVKSDDTNTRLYLEPTSIKKLKSLTPNEASRSIQLFVGPEGGFSENDLQSLDKINAVGINLGPRILRTETAALTCISILQSHFGDL